MAKTDGQAFNDKREAKQEAAAQEPQKIIDPYTSEGMRETAAILREGAGKAVGLTSSGLAQMQAGAIFDIGANVCDRLDKIVDLLAICAGTWDEPARTRGLHTEVSDEDVAALHRLVEEADPPQV